jgi:hypothetical protein
MNQSQFLPCLQLIRKSMILGPFSKLTFGLLPLLLLPFCIVFEGAEDARGWDGDMDRGGIFGGGPESAALLCIDLCEVDGACMVVVPGAENLLRR